MKDTPLPLKASQVSKLAIPPQDCILEPLAVSVTLFNPQASPSVSTKGRGPFESNDKTGTPVMDHDQLKEFFKASWGIVVQQEGLLDVF